MLQRLRELQQPLLNSMKSIKPASLQQSFKLRKLLKPKLTLKLLIKQPSI
jgi:hypothetical protein